MQVSLILFESVLVSYDLKNNKKCLMKACKSYLREEKVLSVSLIDIKIGNIDAKNEILTFDSFSKDGKSSFSNSFYTIDQMFIDSFVEGHSYFVTGLKGSGKTSILRYIDSIVSKNNHCVEYVLFKSDVKEEDREQFSKNSIAIVGDGEFATGNDYESVINIFLHRIICAAAVKNRIFKDNDEFKKYQKLLRLEGEGEFSAIRRFLPRLSKGTLKLAAGVSFIKAEFGAEFEGRAVSEASVPVNYLTGKVQEVFESLKVDSKRKIYILIDELEAAFRNTVQYKRDCCIIRDFIVEIDRINRTSRCNNLNVVVLACLRTEVIRSIDAAGKEINKMVFDFGHQISWHDKGGGKRHPLIALICKKIRAAYQLADRGRECSGDDEDILLQFFPPTVNDIEIERYLLNNSWYRPRDLVRMLMLIQKKYPKSTSFQATAFEGIRKDYSRESWEEITEELLAGYSKGAIVGVREVLLGFRPYFSVADFEKRCNTKKNESKNVAELIGKHTPLDVLKDLYRVGAIGNSFCSTKKGFAFRGDDDFVDNAEVMVHYALRRELSIES